MVLLCFIANPGIIRAPIKVAPGAKLKRFSTGKFRFLNGGAARDVSLNFHRDKKIFQPSVSGAEKPGTFQPLLEMRAGVFRFGEFYSMPGANYFSERGDSALRNILSGKFGCVRPPVIHVLADARITRLGELLYLRNDRIPRYYKPSIPHFRIPRISRF